MLKSVSGLVVGPVGCVQLAQVHIEDVGYFPAGEHSSAPDNDLCRTVEQVICDVGVDGAVKIGLVVQIIGDHCRIPSLRETAPSVCK